MENWLHLSSEALLTGIFIVLLYINYNIGLFIREHKNKKSQPTFEQMQALIEQVNYLKWHVDQIKEYIKYGEPEEETALKKDAEYLKTFQDENKNT